MGLQMRLGIVSVPPGAVCQITKQSGEQCLHTVTSPCEHPHLCKAGSARLRPHKAVMVAVKSICEKQGAFVDLERAIPQLYQLSDDGVVKEAILDVVISSP
eukprot:7642223-Karenia_brevis.AAC.1